MAEDVDYESKTEDPTPRRREEAREQGQIALSPDFNSGVVLMVAVLMLSANGPQLASLFFREIRGTFVLPSLRDLDPAHAVQRLNDTIVTGVLGVLTFVLALAAAGLAIGVLQAGFRPNLDLLGFKWERLLQSGGKIFTLAPWVKGLGLVLKAALLGIVAWWALRNRLPAFLQTAPADLPIFADQSWKLITHLLNVLALALLLWGVADYAYQRWHFERSLRMTKQEVKEEMKRDEGDPQVKGRIRKMQRDIVTNKMYKSVPKATVVVTNPIHLAVALRYDPPLIRTPRVIAKGAGLTAKRIVLIARKNNVPVVERRPLAQALFKSVKLNQDIPYELYRVVLEVLIFVYQLSGRKLG